ncbi:MAG: pyridoxamine 5'-phosphate oxidase family protein [Chloroflexi bacterium]|nr:pyridoxamine 5'-phosphate oxidase family protein [Chloroflexota bacterium]
MAGNTRTLREEVQAYLRDHNTMTLASAADGCPWAATVFYAHRDFDLYFLSDPDSRHCREMVASPTVAATITEDYRDWRQIKGIQLEGVAQPVSSRREQVVALAAYVAKFPFVAGFFPAAGFRLSRIRIGGRPVSVRLYKVVPHRLLYLDNQKGFHHREELSLESSSRV